MLTGLIGFVVVLSGGRCVRGLFFNYVMSFMFHVENGRARNRQNGPLYRNKGLIRAFQYEKLSTSNPYG